MLRARTPAGLEQEIYALPVAYQAIRIAMCDATLHRTNVDPDRASFTIALNAAGDQLTTAAAVIAATTVDLVGAIGRQVLVNRLANQARTINLGELDMRRLRDQQARATTDFWE